MTPAAGSPRARTTALAALVTLAVAALAQVVTHAPDTTMLPAAHSAAAVASAR